MMDQENIPGKGVYAPEVLEFVRSANDFCQWIEEAGQKRAVDFIRSSLQVLSSVYYNLVMIEPLEPVMESSNEKFVTEQDWSEIYQRVMNLLGVHNEYLRIADNGEFDRSDLVTHKISEDMADIYQDLKDFTKQYRQGIEELMNDAVWEVMDNFENYWGVKLLNALQALNRLYVTKVDPEEDDASPVDPGEEESGPSYDNSFFTGLQDFNEEDI